MRRIGGRGFWTLEGARAGDVRRGREKGEVAMHLQGKKEGEAVVSLCRHSLYLISSTFSTFHKLIMQVSPVPVLHCVLQYMLFVKGCPQAPTHPNTPPPLEVPSPCSSSLLVGVNTPRPPPPPKKLTSEEASADGVLLVNNATTANKSTHIGENTGTR